MSSSEEDPENKTEEPSPKRIEDFRKRGEVAFSKDLMAFSGVMAGLLSLGLVGTWGVETFTELWREMMEAVRPVSQGGARLDSRLVVEIMTCFVKILAVPFFVSVFVSLLTGLAQTEGNLSWEPMTPKFEKLNPIPKLPKLFFSMRSAVELAKNAFKIMVLALVAWKVLSNEAVELLRLPLLTLEASLAIAGRVLLKLIGVLCVVMMVFAALDFIWQRYQMNKKMRMSPKEMKDEHKEVEGDPIYKGMRRQRMREMAAQRGRVKLAAEATVVVVNPTHIAVALRYDPNKEGAPRVLCMGADQIAAEIRGVARQAGVPIIQRRSVARLLFTTAKVGSEIPVELFEAVASVLALIMRQRKNK